MICCLLLFVDHFQSNKMQNPGTSPFFHEMIVFFWCDRTCAHRIVMDLGLNDLTRQIRKPIAAVETVAAYPHSIILGCWIQLLPGNENFLARIPLF
jgi:hypothetical protein